MNELIKVKKSSIGGEQVESVDARSLHDFLGSRKDFSNWIKAKVVNNVFFTEGQDYTLLAFLGEQKGRGGHNRKDYALTMETAKKVSMAEQTEAGNKARDYFLECEKVAKGITPLAIENNRKEELDIELFFIQSAATFLRASDSTKLQMMHKVGERHGVSTAALPQYTEKVKVGYSLTHLLKMHKDQCKISVQALNKLLVKSGYVEIKERLAEGGTYKSYKSITEKGLKYGQNDAYQGKSTETQPHYYNDTFVELYDIAHGGTK